MPRAAVIRYETYECKPGLPSLWLEPKLSAAPALMVLTSGFRHSFFAIGDSVPLTRVRNASIFGGVPGQALKGPILLVLDRNKPFGEEILE